MTDAPGRAFRDGDGLPLMVPVPAGRFRMGSPDVPRQIRAAARNRNGAEFRCDDYGVRIARDA